MKIKQFIQDATPTKEIRLVFWLYICVIVALSINGFLFISITSGILSLFAGFGFILLIAYPFVREVRRQRKILESGKFDPEEDEDKWDWSN